MRFTTDNSDLARVRFLQQTAFHTDPGETSQHLVSHAHRVNIFMPRFAGAENYQTWERVKPDASF